MFSTEAVQEHWLGNFVLNLVGYGLIILPSALLIRRWKNSTLVKAGNGPLYGTLHLLVFGNAEDDPLKAVEEEVKKGGGSGGTTETRPFPLPYYAHLIFCIVGLQVSYLIWGVLQESVMTRAYGGDKFTDSQFLVFVNRALALVVAAIYIALFKQPRHTAPFYKYAYPSISNTLSSWCQYEALKFVSFPTQVLAKASKTIPVMLTDKVVSNSTYPCYEYFTASLMSIGVTIFMLSADPDVDQHRSVQTTLAGIVILIGYVAFDSFTSNFESKVFKDYKVSSIQMMLGINLFSGILTVCSLLFRGVFFSAFQFLLLHSEFAVHALLISICSAVGQLFIFHTIAHFGALVFTLIMTTRQAISILISCTLYGHALSAQATIGVALVFLSLFLRTYFKTTEKKASK